ncbi:MAG: class I SAM-dependent methyltransferase [Candidatus Anstonellales archaeon]
MNFQNLSIVLNNPKLLLKFLLRNRNLAKFLQIDEKDVKRYFKESDKITNYIISSIKGSKVTSTMCTPLRGPIVYVCVRALKPEIMVETGVGSGSSTTYILHAMKLNNKGLLYSIELPNVDCDAIIPRGKQIGWLVPEELKSRWRLILGRSQEKLPTLLQDLNSIDAFLHDSEHQYNTMIFEYQKAYAHLRESGLLISDDVHWNNAFIDFTKKIVPKRWIIFDGLGAIIK